jgi:hypothetical protein
MVVPTSLRLEGKRGNDAGDRLAWMPERRQRYARVTCGSRDRAKFSEDKMRVNVYAEEMTDRIDIVQKEGFTGLRIYLELPVTILHPNGMTEVRRGPFIHKPGDDDSSAVTFWGKRDLRDVLRKALAALDDHYAP